jgi:CubicO group peptidase (beta-lactamase class C family)
MAIAESTPEKSSLAAIVTQLVDEDFQQRAHVGVVVGAVAMDQEFLRGFGTRAFGSPEPPDADTVFEIGSITKTFTGLLLAKRINEGKLKLDNRVADLLPEGWKLSEPAANITLGQLTTHTSGFPRLPSNLLGTARLGRSLFGGDPYRNYSEDQFREALEQVELEFEPGEKHLYSNFAVGLLGFVLATHNGSDYETLLKSDLCKPLGMNRTTITNEPWHDEHLAPGYRSSMKLGTAVTVLGSSAWELPNHLAGAGAIRSTGSDMMKYLKANMGLIDTPIDDAIRLSHTTLYEERKDRAIGMNWIRSLDENIEQEVIWHNGGTGGYRSYLGFTADCRFGVVVLCNTQNDADALGQRILREMVRHLGTGESPR